MRNIIDKLANFVARNGPEFEQMTMEKQRDNPKFFFLFGGEYNAYYKWKVTAEQSGVFVCVCTCTVQNTCMVMHDPLVSRCAHEYLLHPRMCT